MIQITDKSQRFGCTDCACIYTYSARYRHDTNLIY